MKCFFEDRKFICFSGFLFSLYYHITRHCLPVNKLYDIIFYQSDETEGAESPYRLGIIRKLIINVGQAAASGGLRGEAWEWCFPALNRFSCMSHADVKISFLSACHRSAGRWIRGRKKRAVFTETEWKYEL